MTAFRDRTTRSVAATAVIPAAGETVANAEGSTSKPVEISGNLTITGEGSDLWLLFGGNFSIGTIEGGYIVMSNDATVTAGSVDLNQPNDIGLSLDGTSSLTVTGSVVAQGDDIDTSGTFDVDGGVSVTNATMEINGGLATVGGALTLDSRELSGLVQGERDRRFIEGRRLDGSGRIFLRRNAQGDG